MSEVKYPEHIDGCYYEGARLPDCGYTEDSLQPVHRSIEDILGEFFEIDRNKLEEEKQQMLKDIRKANEES